MGISIALAVGALLAQISDVPELALERSEAGVRVLIAGEHFTTYKTEEDLKYPYFYPVNGPASGESVTTAGTQPWPHHSSLFFGCDKVNGGNYWQSGNRRGQIVSEGVTLLEDSGPRVGWRDAALWREPGDDPTLRDEREIWVSAPDATRRFIDIAITLTPLVEVTIEKSNHALFSARMTPALSVDGGGTLVNAAGARGEAETFGAHAPWMANYGTHHGETEGLAILQHPQSTWRDAPWFTRDYGFFSPTPMNWLEAPLVLLPGEPVRLYYRVVVFQGDPGAADIAGAYAAFASQPMPDPAP